MLITELGCSPKVRGYDGRSLLHEACWSGSIKLAETLIKDFSLDVDSVDYGGNMPLHIACGCGHKELARVLIIKYNCPVDAVNKNLETPLHVACWYGHSPVVRMLVSEFKGNVMACDCENYTPINKAVLGGHIDTVEVLIIELGCSSVLRGFEGRSLLCQAFTEGNTKLAMTLIIDLDLNPLSLDDVGDTPLHIACLCGHEELARLLITKYSSPVDVKNKKNETPLHKACSSGHSSIARMLISEFKVDITLRDHNNDTAISKAAEGGHVETVCMLITELGCSPKVKGYDGRSLLHEACWSGSVKLAEMLIIDFRLDVLSVDDSGNTPLHLACQGDHEELASLLITKFNCPVDIVNSNKETPLHKACSSGHNSIARMLVSEFKADITRQDRNNDTAISKAAEGGQVETVQVLITELGCSPKVRGYDGTSLLHKACWSGSIKLAEMLIIDFRLDVLSVDDSGNTPLHLACQGGHEELARLLINRYNCPVDIVNSNKETPLHKACSSGHSSIVGMLISEFKADVTQRDHNNDTALSKAAEGGHVGTVCMLITKLGCSPKVKGYDGTSLLHKACWSGSIKLAKMLIIDFRLDILSVDDSGNTPLHMACWGGHKELARLLLTKYNCPVNVNNKIEETPLHQACTSGHSSLVRMLISEFKADVTQRDHNNDTALSKAAEGGQVETVCMLITELGCSPKLKGYDGRSLLHEACWSGSVKLAEMLIIDFSLDILSVDDCGNTPLHLACQGGHEELASLLITKYNCPVDIVNSNKETPLHKACSFGHLNVARMLISEFKANSDSQNHQNDTSLCVAVLNGHKRLVRALITKFGCDPQVKGFEGRSLLHHACDQGQTELAMFLIAKFELDALSVDDSGNTPLHLACQGGHEELARLLITKYNCPVDIVNSNKETPLHRACSRGHLDVSKVLVSENMLKGDRRFCNTLDKNGNTPLDLVIKRDDAKAVHVLSTEYGCKAHVRGAESKPLLHQLAARGFTKMLQELISNFSHDPASTDEVGNTILLTAAQHGRYKMVEFLIANHKNQCPIDYRNSRGQTALHCACIGGHTRVAKLLVASKADITVRDEDGDTPLKKAFLANCQDTLFEMFDSDLRTIDSKLLCQLCERGSVDLVDILLSDFSLDPSSVLDDRGNQVLHLAALHGHKEVIVLLINKYKCPADSRNSDGQTPLHLLCSQTQAEGVDVLIKLFIMELKADVSAKDKYSYQPIHAAARAGNIRTVINFLDHGCNPDSRGFKNRNLLHCSLVMGHTLTAQILISVFHLSLHCTDDDGNTPLHLSSLYAQPESVRLLLYNYHAPLYLRNKAGKTALDLATEDSTKKVIREYAKSEHKRIQREYDELRTKSLYKFSGEQIITRVFVLGNPGSGKSTLVESLKRKGKISSFKSVTEADVPPHTAGIVPSVHQSKEAGRLLYYDFAGDKEYFSSHAAILEIISHLSAGSNVYFIVADLRKDNMTIHTEIGYWLSFISCHRKVLDSQRRLKTVVILSHSDHLSLTDSASRVEGIRQYFHAQMNQYDEMFDLVEVVSSNCRSPRSSRNIESILQRISKDTPPCSISYETSLLHGLLEKDFSNVVACRFQDLLSNIKDTGICLPTVADALYPIVKELHDIGLLMMIGRKEDRLEDHLLLLDPSSLTHEVHQRLFSNSTSVMQDFNSPASSHRVSQYYADMGILPESYLASVLPEHITKECLVQLQYCQEFTCADVGLNSSEPGVSNNASENRLLYFPALCKLDSEQSNWPTDPQLNFSIGWYVKCTGKFDYFPARFLHVLLLRLAFAFALPNVNCNVTEFNEISAHNRRCTMWKNGIRWLMEEGVECIFEMVNDNKGIVFIIKSQEHSDEWAEILPKIIAKALQAKSEFCDTVSLQHFLFNSGSTSSFKDHNKLFAVSDVERVIRERNKMAVSVSGRGFLDMPPALIKLIMTRQYTTNPDPKQEDTGIVSLSESDHKDLYEKLSKHSEKWREIGIYLGFCPSELNNIKARPLLLATAPNSWLDAMLAEWLQWAPGDSRGSTSSATLTSLRQALIKAGFHQTAQSL